MNIDVLSIQQLNADHFAAWRRIQANNPHLSSPYFCPEFTQITAATRNSNARQDNGGEVQVAIFTSEQTNDIVGFFPFWREAGRTIRKKDKTKGIARPIAGPLTDFQGLIANPDTAAAINPQTLLKQCGLSQLHFDHLLASQASFKPYQSCVVPSTAIDITAGYDAYMQERQQVSRSRFKDMARLRRKLTKEFGPVRYEAHVNDPAILAQVLEWKSQQFIRTGLADVFATPWTRQLITEIFNAQTENFSGMLSVLYAGDQLLAAHMGMRSQTVWHYWLPVYDHQFKKFSPGLLLLLSIVEEAAERNMHTVDLGKGKDGYKPLFGNCETLVAEGCAAVPSLEWTLTQATQQTTQTLKKVARRAKRWVREPQQQLQ